MTPQILQNIGWLLLQASVVSCLLLLFFRLRHRFGLALLAVTLGTFQHLQTQLAAILYLEIWPGIFVSPGSTVMFTATLFATLLIYIRDDVFEARSLIIGVVAANVTLTIIMLIVQQQALGLAGSAAAASPLFSADIKPLLTGTALLCLDVFLIIVIYEFFFHLFRHSLFIRIALAMMCIVCIDTIVFVSVNFYTQENFTEILVSGLIGKNIAALFYSTAMFVYLKVFPSNEQVIGDHSRVRDVFHILTYRQRYELLKDELARDSMTGLFNRGFLDRTLPSELERAANLQHGLNLMLVDLDHFKSINDEFGHQVGDQVIMLLADSMKRLFRMADIPCRYGGEEFAIILPDSSARSAFISAHRLRRRMREMCEDADLPIPVQRITFTAGIASYPEDADTADALLKIADTRLYEGKNNGRDQVINGDIEPMFEDTQRTEVLTSALSPAHGRSE